MVSVQLHQTRVNRALKEAEYGRYAFVSEPEKLAFCVVEDISSQPVYEFFFAEDSAVWHENEDREKIFRASRIKPSAEDSGNRTLVSEEFAIVGQLRPSYATRVLAIVGQHLSRIGLDFVSMPD